MAMGTNKASEKKKWESIYKVEVFHFGMKAEENKKPYRGCLEYLSECLMILCQRHFSLCHI